MKILFFLILFLLQIGQIIGDQSPQKESENERDEGSPEEDRRSPENYGSEEDSYDESRPHRDSRDSRYDPQYGKILFLYKNMHKRCINFRTSTTSTFPNPTDNTRCGCRRMGLQLQKHGKIL